MNFVTFNQDHSHLGVGKSMQAVCNFSTDMFIARHHKWLSHIYHRSFHPPVRVARGRCLEPGNALLDLAGCPHAIPASPPHSEHQGQCLLARTEDLLTTTSATLNDMRDDLPHSYTGYAVEQEATRRSSRKRALYIRHQQHAIAQERKDLPQPLR
jgi:hypothetical protein